MADTPKKKEPTASEAMFFFAIVKHTRNKADIDWTAVAAEQGFKNANVAKVSLHGLALRMQSIWFLDVAANANERRSASARSSANWA